MGQPTCGFAQIVTLSSHPAPQGEKEAPRRASLLPTSTPTRLRPLDFAPPTAAPEMGSSGTGSYLDPELVFAFVRSNRPRDLFRYLNSVPGATADLHCRLASFAGAALLAPRPGSPPWPDKDSWAPYWAKYAWAHAVMSRLYVPQMAGNPFGYSSDPVGRHAAIINQLEASSSSTPTAMLPPQQTNYNAVFNFPITPAPTLDGAFAFNLGRHASNFAPWGTDSTLELAFTKLSLSQPGSEQRAPQELMQNNSAMGLLSPRKPRSAQLTPQRLMQNREVDIKGKGPASEVDEQKVLVHVATLMADGTTGAAGLLIKKGTRQFLCASCFPMPATQPVLLAAACCEGIKIARAYQPSTILVESHLSHLLGPYLASAHALCPEIEELKKLLDQSRCIVGSITEECNSTACKLALYSLVNEVAEIFFGALPDRVVLN